MTAWKTRGLRGSTLEEMINRSNEQYREQGLALIQKVPTPITPVRMDKDSRQITLAYFDKKSTVDYIGAVQGIPVCFDAKECATDTFPISNIHEHQYIFMRDFEKQKGVAFLLIMFTAREEIYYMRFTELDHFWQRAADGGPRHFTVSELAPAYYLPQSPGILVPYLVGINRDLQTRED